MKKIINNILILFSAAIFMVACDKDELTVLNPNATTTVSLSASDVVLVKANAGTDVLTVSWTEPEYGFEAGTNFKVIFSSGDKTIPVSVGSELSKVFENVQLNKLLLNLGLEGNTPAEVSIKVEAVLSAYHSLISNTASFSATAYTDKLDLSTTWGIVGSAAVNGWDGPDMPFYKTDNNDELAAYVTLATGEIKFRENNDWTLNYGDTGVDGVLDKDGDNIVVTAGTYKITFNTSALTYTIVPFTYGLVGDATTNGWDGPDMPLTYDSFSNTWKAIVTIADGKIKFRFNNDWGLNYGDDGVDGTLEAGGADIVVTAGNYLVTLDLNSLEYKLEPINIWGLVGDAAPNGWDGPNAKFTLDFEKEGVWVLNGVTLTDGKIKFRTNDSWDVNYGDDGADGTLEAGGADISVTAGTYDIVLDFSDANAPTYSITAK